jgi:hypothetical protein
MTQSRTKKRLSPPICCYDERLVHSCDTNSTMFTKVWGRIKNTGLNISDTPTTFWTGAFPRRKQANFLTKTSSQNDVQYLNR